MANKKKNSNTNNLKFIINAQYLKDLSFENLQEINHNSVKNNEGNITLDMNVVYQAYDGDFFSLI